jgi:ParB family transcriptional regulator, chromosome partitioning protein
MARRRLPPPPMTEGGVIVSSLETTAYPLLGIPAGTRPPVARVAAEAATEAALREVSAELGALRAEGRILLRLPLSAVQDDWLIRDRIVTDASDLNALRDSMRSHGQRLPIEVADLGQGRFGLISGWRRMVVLRALATEDSEGDGRFASVLALVRTPATSAAAYVAMIEENEIRADLSYWERARVVSQAVAAGVFADEREGLRQLFASASRARRSKIGSFLGLVAKLDGVLRFPASLPERLGLRLATALAADPGLTIRLGAVLANDPPATATAEQAIIAAMITGKTVTTAPVLLERRDLAPGLWLEIDSKGRAILGGAAVDERFLDRLASWIRSGGADG